MEKITVATMTENYALGGRMRRWKGEVEISSFRHDGDGITRVFVRPLDPSTVPLSARNGWWVHPEHFGNIMLSAREV